MCGRALVPNDEHTEEACVLYMSIDHRSERGDEKNKGPSARGKIFVLTPRIGEWWKIVLTPCIVGTAT
jgi:hypothetical protein